MTPYLSKAPRIAQLDVAAYKIPTDAPESDGTYVWDSTVLVVAELRAGDARGLGYTYADAATARLIHDKLFPVIQGQPADQVAHHYLEMWRAIRNLGRPGIAAMGISAVDVALWDLHAKLLNVSLARLFGPVRERVPLYGSGGFTAYSVEKLQRQLAGWRDAGLGAVKMKVGRDPDADPSRVAAAREAIGPTTALFVDANGAYSRKQALALADAFSKQGVSWFEEPVSSDDLEGLRLVRDRAPAGMDISAGEYGYEPYYFRRMIETGAVDVLQADATRCGGYSGFLQASALCQSWGLGFSSHCAPSLHLPAAAASIPLRHIEYFHDHVRIEEMLFDGTPRPAKGGTLEPDFSRPGIGLDLKRQDAARFAI